MRRSLKSTISKNLVLRSRSDSFLAIFGSAVANFTWKMSFRHFSHFASRLQAFCTSGWFAGNFISSHYYFTYRCRGARWSLFFRFFLERILVFFDRILRGFPAEAFNRREILPRLGVQDLVVLGGLDGSAPVLVEQGFLVEGLPVLEQPANRASMAHAIASAIVFFSIL